MMKRQWSIRKASIEDAVALQKCMELAYASYLDRMQGSALPPMDLDYAVEIAEFPTWVAEHDDRIAGGLTMVFGNDHASIANIAVNPEMQGQGLGGGLIQFAEKQAIEKKYTELHLATHVLLTENISWYHHLGWVEFDRDVDKVYLKKDIAF